MNALSWLFFFPLVAAVLMLVPSPLPDKGLKRQAVLFSLVPLLILISFRTDILGASFQKAWFPALGIQFYLTVDSLSLIFLFLTAIIIPISLFSVNRVELSSPRFFYCLVFLLQSFLIGFFCAQDLVVFTLFWEAMLLPIYFIIGIWGKGAARQTALKFLIYMLAGSVFFIAAVLALYFGGETQMGSGTFDMASLVLIAEKIPHAKWIFFALLLAFAVKTPLFPFHAWLPDSYQNASTPGTILLSAVLSKAGIYGIARILIPFFPTLFQEWGKLLFILALVGVLYGGLAACVQKDFKRLIAYSSFSHVNFILAGLFIWQGVAYSGAILQAFNHGITMAGLFLVAGWLELRLGSTQMGQVSGLAKFTPRLCWLTLVFVLSSVALPGTNNFVGEILILFGAFKTFPWLTPILGLTVILSVVYSLRFMQKIYFEAPVKHQPTWVDLNRRELCVALPLVFLIFWIGIYPSPILKQIDSSAIVKEEKELVMIHRENNHE